MNTIKVQIVEDDQSYALELEMMLTELGYEVLPWLDDPAKVSEDVIMSADVIVADIYFNGKPSGIQLAQQSEQLRVPTILLTSQPNAAVYHESRGALAAGFAVKPIAQLSLQSLIEKAMLARQNPLVMNQVMNDWQQQQIITNYIFVRHGGALVKLSVANISRIEADGNYCYIFEGERRFAVKSSLRHLKKMLVPRGFVQVSRGQLANFNMVEQVDFKNAFLVVAGTELAIGNAYRKEVEGWLNAV